MVNTTPSFWDQENKGQDWGQPGTVGQQSRQEAEIRALVRPGEADAFPSLSSPAANSRPCTHVTGLRELPAQSVCPWLPFPARPGTRRRCSRSSDVHRASLTGAWPSQACSDPRSGGPVLGLNPRVPLSPCEVLEFWTGGTAVSVCSGSPSCMAGPGFLLVLRVCLTPRVPSTAWHRQGVDTWG